MAATEILAEAFGDGVHPDFATMSDSDARNLVSALNDARRAQAQALAQAGSSAIGHLPRPFRMAVSKALGL